MNDTVNLHIKDNSSIDKFNEFHADTPWLIKEELLNDLSGVNLITS